jgi:putative copper export protein
MSAAWGGGLLAVVVCLFSFACRFYHRADPPAWTRHESIAVCIALAFAAGVSVSAGLLLQYVLGLDDGARGPVLLTGAASLVAVALFWTFLARHRRRAAMSEPGTPPPAVGRSAAAVLDLPAPRRGRNPSRRKAA